MNKPTLTKQEIESLLRHAKKKGRPATADDIALIKKEMYDAQIQHVFSGEIKEAEEIQILFDNIEHCEILVDHEDDETIHYSFKVEIDVDRSDGLRDSGFIIIHKK